MNWNLHDFRALCQRLGLQDAEEFISALDEKFFRANYHTELSNSEWNNFSQIQMKLT